jgi:hypothetical protein
MRNPTTAALLAFTLCVLTLTLSDGQTPTTPTTTPNKAQTTGTQIGEIVSSAVNTAFPVIGKIMDLFTGNKKNASKPEVQAAVTKAQTDAVTAAKQKIKDVATVSKELGVIQAFGTAGVSASQNLATINRLLAENTTDYGKVNEEWQVAKNYLADVLVMKPADIQAVRDVTIQARIVTLQKARKDLMTRIDDDIASAQKKPGSFSKPDFQKEITAMSGLLDGFDTLAAVELSTLQADIDDLAKWANSPAGVIEFTPKKPSQNLLKIIDDAAMGAQSVANRQ